MQTGVLILHSSKTYGRTDNKKRLLYKCIPNHRFMHSSAILLPYDVSLGFSKHIQNKFVAFHLIRENQGVIDEIFGDVNDVEAYYEYQRASRQLKGFPTKPKFSLTADCRLLSSVENRFFENVFTIDGKNTTDFDDAFSLKPRGIGGWTLSIYITNVAKYVHHFGLWDALMETTMTTANIYLPHRKIRLLPASLVSHHISLQEGKERYTLCLDISLDTDGNVVDTHWTEALISVKKNHIYESPELLASPHYKLLKRITPVLTSHDCVAYWMEYYNNTIVNCSTQNREKIIYVHHYSITHCKIPPKGYYLYNENNANTYIHCTSPIRRTVDIYNQAVFLGLPLHCPNIEWVNEKTRNIRSLQMECALMQVCFSNDVDLDTVYSGIIFDNERKNNGNEFTCLVYIESLKLISKITSNEELPLFSPFLFRLFTFQDEHTIQKKIRLQRIEKTTVAISQDL
jgi:hypothetical protein